MFGYFEWLLLAFPLSGACINAFLGRRLTRRAQLWVAMGALSSSLFILIPLLASQVLRPGIVGRPQAIPWFRVWSGERFLQGPLALRIDALSVFAASATVAGGLVLVTYAARHLPSTTPRHIVLAALDAVLTALLLVVLADNPMCLLLGWALSGWCMHGLARTLQASFPPSAQADGSLQTASPPIALIAPRMISMTSDLSLLFALGFLATVSPSWSVDTAPALARFTAPGVSAPRELWAAALLLLLASLIRVGQRSACARFLGGESSAADALVYALSSGFPGVYLIVRGSPLVTLTFLGRLSGLLSRSSGSALPWWWFGLGSGIIVLGYGLARRLFSSLNAARRPAWATRVARRWDPVRSSRRYLAQPLVHAGEVLARSVGVDWVQRTRKALSSLLHGAAPADDEPLHLTLCFLLLGTVLVLAYLLLR